MTAMLSVGGAGALVAVNVDAIDLKLGLSGKFGALVP